MRCRKQPTACITAAEWVCRRCLRKADTIVGTVILAADWRILADAQHRWMAAELGIEPGALTNAAMLTRILERHAIDIKAAQVEFGEVPR